MQTAHAAVFARSRWDETRVKLHRWPLAPLRPKRAAYGTTEVVPSREPERSEAKGCPFKTAAKMAALQNGAVTSLNPVTQVQRG